MSSQLKRRLDYGRAMMWVMLVNEENGEVSAKVMSRLSMPLSGVGSKEPQSAYTGAKLLEATVVNMSEGCLLDEAEMAALTKLFPYIPELQGVKKIEVPEERVRQFAKKCASFAQNGDDSIVDFISLWQKSFRAFVIVPFPATYEY